MTTNYHTPITTGAAANSAIINAPLGELDAAISGISGGGDTVKVSAADTTADELDAKIAAGTAITLTILNPGGDEDLEVKVSDGGITATQLASDAVTTAKILDANVTAAKLATDSVTTAKIADDNVTTAKIADQAVTRDKLGAEIHYRNGCAVKYEDAGNVTVTAGIIEIDGQYLVETSDVTTIALATAGNWIDGDSEGASEWVYVYLYNDSGSGWGVKLSNQVPAYSDTDSNTGGIKRYRLYNSVWYRCVGAVYNDASSDIMLFDQERNGIVLWDDPNDHTVLSGGTSTTYVDVDLSAHIPIGVSQRAWIQLYGSDQSRARKKGSSAAFQMIATSGATVPGPLETDTSGYIQYRIWSTGTCTIYVAGWIQEL